MSTPKLPHWGQAELAYEFACATENSEYPEDSFDQVSSLWPTPKEYLDLPYEVRVALEWVMNYACNGEWSEMGEYIDISAAEATQYWDFAAEVIGWPTGEAAMQSAAWQMRGN